MPSDELVVVSQIDLTETWITPYQRYLVDGLLPAEPTQAKMIERNAGRYTLVDGKLFCHGYAQPTLMCVSGDQCVRIMSELHEGICGSHIDGRSLALKAIRAGFYWPTFKEDCRAYAQQCKQC